MSLRREQLIGLAIVPFLAPVPYAIFLAVAGIATHQTPRGGFEDLAGYLLVSYGMYAVMVLYGMAGAWLLGLPAALVFDRRGVTGLAPHLLVGVALAAIPAALFMRNLSGALAMIPGGLVGATIYWFVARPDRAPSHVH